jgi:hypothetical protein
MWLSISTVMLFAVACLRPSAVYAAEITVDAAQRPQSEAISLRGSSNFQNGTNATSASPSPSPAPSNNSGSDNLPQWQQAVFAMIGCFGAMGCMLGLKLCTKCYGRIKRSLCATKGDDYDDGIDEARAVAESSSAAVRSKKAAGSSSKKQGRASKGKKGGYARVDQDEEW